MKKFPKLIESQVAVIRAEVQTGQIFDVNGRLYISEEQEMYQIFENRDEAEKYIYKILEKSQVFEFSIFDHMGELTAVFHN